MKVNKQLLFSFKGRLNRKAFWLARILAFVSMVFPMIAIFAIFGALDISDAVNERPESTASEGMKALATLIIIPFGIAYTWAVIAITVKRFHDMGRSGWFALYLLIGILPFIGFISWIVTIVIGCIKGTIGPNKHGPDPLEIKAL